MNTVNNEMYKKIMKPLLHFRREYGNKNKSTFDFIDAEIRVCITSYDEALNFCKVNKKALIEYAVETLASSKRFERYGITTDWLKVDNIIFTNQKVLDIMFVLK